MTPLIRLSTYIYWDWRFFAILPALNINIHSRSLEFEWLWLGVYLNHVKYEESTEVSR